MDIPGTWRNWKTREGTVNNVSKGSNRSLQGFLPGWSRELGHAAHPSLQGPTAPHCLAPLQACFVGRTEKKGHENGAGSREGVSRKGAEMRK